MGYIIPTYSFTPGTAILSGQVNQNFTDLMNGLQDHTKDVWLLRLSLGASASYVNYIYAQGISSAGVGGPGQNLATGFVGEAQNGNACIGLYGAATSLSHEGYGVKGYAIAGYAAYGGYFEAANNASTFGNFGVWASAKGSAGNDWAFWADAGKSYFAEDIVLGAGADIHTGVGWIDWSASTNPQGFSSTSNVSVFYKQIGGFVEVNGVITGTSNQTYFNFTLPISATGGTYSACKVTDSGAAKTTPGMIETIATTCNVRLDFSGAGWTASGTKEAKFHFRYIIF